MRITKQLSENEFVVKMDESDLKEYESLVVAHDYVQFSQPHGYMLSSDFEGKVTGKFAGAALNWIKAYQSVQIDIRDMIEIVLPLLNNHPNCQPEHLVTKNGEPTYKWNSSKLVFTENGVKKIALRKMGEDKYSIVDFDTYQAIKNKEF